MLDVDPLPVPPRPDSRFCPDEDNAHQHPLAAPGCRLPSQLLEGMDRDPPADDPGGPASRVNRTSGREPLAQAAGRPLLGSLLTTDAQLGPAGSAPQQEAVPSSSTSQNTSEINRVFTPTMSDSGSSGAGLGNGPDPSQESQLLRLSQLAAAQEKMPDVDASASPVAALSRKRMADGMVKHVRHRSSASPVRSGGHSRNTSTVSVASTSTSRVGEVCCCLDVERTTEARAWGKSVLANYGDPR